MLPGEIYIAKFPFGDVAGMKLRPVLLLTGSVGSVQEVLVAYISSVIPAQLLPSDLVVDPMLAEFQNSHLKVMSTVRLHKLATIHCSSLARRLGHVEPAHRTLIATKLKAFLGF
jgi:mRNA interferase MazF